MRRARPAITPVSCPACRSKVDPARDRCPRCQSPLGRAGAQDGRTSRRLGQTAAALVAVCLIGWPGIYLTRPGSGIAADSPPPDPLAARRSVPDTPVTDELPAPTTELVARPTVFEPTGDLPTPSSDHDVEHAVARLTIAIDERPHDAEAHSALGELLVNLSRTPEALPYLRAAVELNPDRAAYHLALARGLRDLGLRDEARAAYRAALTLAPDDATITSELAGLLQQTTRAAAGVDPAIQPTDAGAQPAGPIGRAHPPD